MVSEFAYPILGGVSEHVHFLSRELAALGHEVTVVTSKLTRAAGEAAEADREAERLHGYRTVRVGRSVLVVSNGSISRGSGGPVGFKRQVSRALAGMHVVHAQGLAAPTLPLFGLRTSTAPVTVGTFHSWFPDGTYQRIYRTFSPLRGQRAGPDGPAHRGLPADHRHVRDDVPRRALGGHPERRGHGAVPAAAPRRAACPPGRRGSSSSAASSPATPSTCCSTRRPSCATRAASSWSR